jgi:hypothetical protein
MTKLPNFAIAHALAVRLGAMAETEEASARALSHIPEVHPEAVALCQSRAKDLRHAQELLFWLAGKATRLHELEFPLRKDPSTQGGKR